MLWEKSIFELTVLHQPSDLQAVDRKYTTGLWGKSYLCDPFRGDCHYNSTAAEFIWISTCHHKFQHIDF